MAVRAAHRPAFGRQSLVPRQHLRLVRLSAAVSVVAAAASADSITCTDMSV